jgi:predicted nucleic acid-binding Zn ribbon protein
MPRNQTSGNKPKMSREQRTLRRNQLIFVGLSVILILSMVISLIQF